MHGPMNVKLERQIYLIKFQYVVQNVIIFKENETINFNSWHLRVFVFSDWTEMQCCKT